MAERYGRYETIREIASGGMATVYLGRAVGEGGFQRLVAIKVMHPHLATDREFVAMFLDEARLAARIRHPNVVATFDVQKSAEGMFLVMDYVEGATLHEVIRHLRTQGESLATGIALRIVLDVLTGLHAAHELKDDAGQLLNLIHRDVSPQNILVGTDGVARLTDFGVARAESRLSSTRGGQLKGKVAYMAPEQIVDDPVDRRADVYAAGAVLWEALVGRRLFRAANDGALVHAILGGAPKTPTEVNERIPEPISRACMRALATKVEGRFPTAAAFADELEDAARLHGLPIASSRAVATFMEQILPDVVQSREISGLGTGSVLTGGTPSEVASGSGFGDRSSAPGSESPISAPTRLDTPAQRPNGDATEEQGAAEPRSLESEAYRVRPADGHPGLVELERRSTSTRRAIFLVVGGVMLVAALGVWALLGPGPGSGAASSATSSSDPAGPVASPPTLAPTTSSQSGASLDAAAPTVSVTTDDGSTAAEPYASASTPKGEPLAPTARPTTRPSASSTATRPRPTSTAAKPSPTSYDPDQL